MTVPFLVVGAMKSGTTTLESVLRNLPDVELINEKESSALLNPGGHEELAGAIGHSAARAAGEVTTAYMQRPLHEVDTGRAAEVLGQELVIIAVLRDPYLRALSHWRHWAQLSMNPDDTVDALLDPSGPYVAFSRYAYQLEPWIRAVGADRLLPLRLEDYALDPRAWTSPLSRFLGTPEPDRLQMLHANAGDTRVVARGLGKRLMESFPYRTFVRPLVPPAARRLGALALGGRRGGQRVDDLPEALEARFRDLVAEDAAELRRYWPGMMWPPSQVG